MLIQAPRRRALDAAEKPSQEMSEELKTRTNWIIDKVLIGVAAFLLIKSYDNVTDSIQRFGDRISDLEHRTRMLEYRIDHPTTRKPND